MNNAALICSATISSAVSRRSIGRITHFASRDAMDIDTFSVMTADQLYKECEVHDPADLYALTYDDLIKLDRFGEKKARKLLDALEKSKDRDLASFLFALGIPNTGKATTKTLSRSLWQLGCNHASFSG